MLYIAVPANLFASLSFNSVQEMSSSDLKLSGNSGSPSMKLTFHVPLIGKDLSAVLRYCHFGPLACSVVKVFV